VCMSYYAPTPPLRRRFGEPARPRGLCSVPSVRNVLLPTAPPPRPTARSSFCMALYVMEAGGSELCLRAGRSEPGSPPPLAFRDATYSLSWEIHASHPARGNPDRERFALGLVSRTRISEQGLDGGCTDAETREKSPSPTREGI
jgi:hypothetical protein